MYNMVRFRRATRGLAVLNWWSNNSNQIAFSRGGIGFVAINLNSSMMSQKILTTLPAGTYCNILTLQGANGDTSGCAYYIVDDQGYVQANIAAMEALVLLVGY